MSQLLLLYSDYGIEFVEKEIGKALYLFENLNKLYNKIKKAQEKIVLKRVRNI